MMRRSVLYATFVCLSASFAHAQTISWQEGFAPVVEKVMPSVVNITVRTREGMGGGAGFVISPDGLIATNAHVVLNAGAIRVHLSDKRRLEAKVVGIDTNSDLAVLRVKASGLRPVTFADSGRVRPGEFVLALGNPFGLSGSVAMGIVSAVARRSLGAYDYEDFIQTDAAVNPGNSGGPLVNARGEVVGVNSMILSRSGGSNGVSFAISSNLARFVIDQLVKDGRVTRGFLGVQFVDEEDGAVLVGKVVPKSPAAAAGLRLGDIVVAMNGRSIYDASDLRLEIAQTRPGAEIVLGVLREGARKEIRAKLVPRPDR